MPLDIWLYQNILHADEVLGGVRFVREGRERGRQMIVKGIIVHNVCCGEQR